MSVEIVCRVAGRKISLSKVKRNARKILALVKERDAELSLAFVANREIERLNRKYRNKPKPTDVLSFPADGILAGRRKLLDRKSVV